MRCEACESKGQDHDELKKLILQSPYFTGKFICNLGWFDKGDLHRDLDTWYRTGLSRGYRRFLVLTPRGHLKTSYFGIALMVNLILNNPEIRILYRMSSASNAEKTLSAVTEVLLGSNGMQHFFPERILKPTSRDVRIRADMIKVERKGTYREATVEARGIDSKIIGGHYNVQIFDDLIDENMIDSDAQQEVAVSRMMRSEPLFVDPSIDLEIVIGTRWPGRYYRWLIDDSGITDEYWTMLVGCYVDERFRRFMRSIGKECLLEDGTPIWPEHFTLDTLAKIHKKMQDNFIHQYLNIEVEEGARRFVREDFQHYKLNQDMCVITYPNGKTYSCPLADMYISMTIDPATGENSRTDQSAITVCGFDRKTGFVFVLDVWQARCLPDVLINQIIDTADRWKPHVVSPEDVSFQKTLKHFLRQEMARRNVTFRIKPVAPGRTGKGRRILDSLQPFVANHQLHVLKSHDHSLVSELVAMQVVGGKVVGRSPNLADSLSYHAVYWTNIEQELNEDEDDIKLFNHKAVPAYGLVCLT